MAACVGKTAIGTWVEVGKVRARSFLTGDHHFGGGGV